MKPRARLMAALAVLAAPGPWMQAATAEPVDRLQPYQMVRSLELVQDRIAGGDHAALPMQKKLLELIDARFRAAGGADFAERRNFDALMIYAMSGGNPATVAATLEGLSLHAVDSAATAGILHYLAGDVAAARAAMEAVDPEAHSQEVAAFLALVKGSVVANDSARAGLRLLDRARLLAPGTLVEEAALRRILALSVTESDAGRFLRGAEQYARRFLRSPYAAQFAETFVSGVIALRDGLDLAAVEQAVAWMTPEQARTVYLRLARRAAIDGDAELLAFASRHARVDDAASVDDVRDARSTLYASISSVTSDSVAEVLARLGELDASQLSASDRALLEAARAVASEVIAPVTPRPAMSRPAPPPDREAPAPLEAAADPLVVAARARLEEIDRLLEEGKP